MYIVIEMQTTGEQVGILTYSYTDRYQAESQFHTLLAAAAISAIPVHSAVLLKEDGQPLMRASYNHETQTEEGEI